MDDWMDGFLRPFVSLKSANAASQDLLPSLAFLIFFYLMRPSSKYLHRNSIHLYFVTRWNEISYTREAIPGTGTGAVQHGIARYLWRERCAVCGARSARAALCELCAADTRAQRAAATLVARRDTAYKHVSYCDNVSLDPKIYLYQRYTLCQ